MKDTPTMIQTGETSAHIYYQAHLDGQLIGLVRDKATDELLFDAHSVALALGYPDAATLLNDPIAMEAIQEYIHETGENPIHQLQITPKPDRP
jgi:hypothetical protein